MSTGSRAYQIETDELLSNSEHSGKRFFMWAHYVDPHAEYVKHEGAPDFKSGGPVGEVKALYDGEVWFTDKQVGKLIDYVSSQPWGKKTAIIVTADHGEAFAEHGMSWHGVDMWESLVRVPMTCLRGLTHKCGACSFVAKLLARSWFTSEGASTFFSISRAIRASSKTCHATRLNSIRWSKRSIRSERAYTRFSSQRQDLTSSRSQTLATTHLWRIVSNFRCGTRGSLRCE